MRRVEKVRVSLTVNGDPVDLEVPAHRRLLDLLRDHLGLTGTKEGCGAGECGACTVLLDGRPVDSCLVLAAQADGCSVLTVEGLSRQDGLHPIQAAFIDQVGVQCGFCTPGFVVAAKAILDANPTPTDDEILEGLTGNLCRCTGYVKIVAAVRDAASRLRAEAGAPAGAA